MSSIATIPRELRDIIYTNVLHTPIIRGSTDPGAAVHPIIAMAQTASPILAEILLPSSSNLSKPSSSFFWRHGRFVVYLRDPLTSKDKTCMQKELESQLEILQKARHVHIEILLSGLDMHDVYVNHGGVVPPCFFCAPAIFDPWPVASADRPEGQKITVRVRWAGLYSLGLKTQSRQDTPWTSASPAGTDAAIPYYTDDTLHLKVAPNTVWTAIDLCAASRAVTFIAATRAALVRLIPGVRARDIMIDGEKPADMSLIREPGGNGFGVFYRLGSEEGRVEVRTNDDGIEFWVRKVRPM